MITCTFGTGLVTGYWCLGRAVYCSLCPFSVPIRPFVSIPFHAIRTPFEPLLTIPFSVRMLVGISDLSQGAQSS